MHKIMALGFGCLWAYSLLPSSATRLVLDDDAITRLSFRVATLEAKVAKLENNDVATHVLKDFQIINESVDEPYVPADHSTIYAGPGAVH